jgi:hypothetical protein
VQNSDRDNQRDQQHSEVNHAHIHFAAVPDYPGNSTGNQGSGADAQNRFDGKPDNFPDVFDDEKEPIAFDPIQDFFVLNFTHDLPPDVLFLARRMDKT